MNQHYFSLKNLIRFTTVLITINTVLGVAPLDIFPNLSQSVQAQGNSETIVEQAAKKFQKEDYLGAIKDLTEAIRLDPNNAELYLVRGVSYRYSGNFEKAIEDCNQAIRISPNYADAYLLRGPISLILETQKTKEDFEKALTLYKQQGNFSQAKEIEAKVKEFDEIFNVMITEIRK
jgi:Tfp pilus assembly protein PilF